VDLLDDVERARLAALVRVEDQQRFVLGCAVTRRVLGALLLMAPAAVPLDRTCPDCTRPHGKVRLARGSSVEMSLSHSGDLVVVAFHADRPVGVDVEQINALLKPAELTGHVLTRSEAELLDGLDADARVDAFTTYWARKEAVVKATGEGLRAPLRDLEVSAPSEPPRLLTSNGRPSPSATQLSDLDAGPGYAAALAVLSDAPVRVTEVDAGPLLAAD
jgi:4'-phosphopantetheinyl transferase